MAQCFEVIAVSILEKELICQAVCLAELRPELWDLPGFAHEWGLTEDEVVQALKSVAVATAS